MLIETTQRVRDGLAELIRLANAADTSTPDLRALLVECKAFGGQLAVLQADTAAGVAARERHGDSGAGVLAQAAGLSRREAAGQVQTAQRLQSMPEVRDAVKSGDISYANAKTLAKASANTSAAQVVEDGELLKKAAGMSPEQFAREADRWTVQRRADGGDDAYRRQRARRRLSFWDGDDGMVHLRGELDPVTGAKVRTRFLQEVERLRRADLHSPGAEPHSFHQRMADALDTLSSHGSIYGRGRGSAQRGAGYGSGAGVGGASANTHSLAGSDKPGVASEAGDGVGKVSQCRGGCGTRPSADIVIVQHLSADGTEAFAEIAGGGAIPQSVLEEHFCDAEVTGVVFSDKGLPLWQGPTKQTATEAQKRALRALYGACGGCGAPLVLCQFHHIDPRSQGGPTDIDNLMPLCCACHQKVHHHGWRVVPDGQGLHTIEPPERIRYGPARAPDPPAAHGAPPPRSPERGEPPEPASPRAPALSQTDHSQPPHQPESLFTLM